jgi:hypothetical protein
MTTNAITTNPAAALAAQAEAGQAARANAEQRKPPVEAPRESRDGSRYAERQAERKITQNDDRGTKYDRTA